MNIGKYFAVMGSIDAFVLLGGMFARSSLKPGFANPPLGQILNFVLPLCLLIGVTLTTLTPMLFRRKKHFVLIVLVGAVFSAGAGIWYVTAIQRFGRPIVIPQRQIDDFIIAGRERTSFANKYFASKSDFEMLTSRGWGENDLFLYWTKDSILRARTTVLLSFVLTLCFVNLMVAGAAALTVPKK